MSLEISFKGKTIRLKSTRKYSDLKQQIKDNIPQLQNSSWQFYFYDDEGDNIEVIEELDYKSLLDEIRKQKGSVRCEIRNDQPQQSQQQSSKEQSQNSSDKAASINNSSEPVSSSGQQSEQYAEPQTVQVVKVKPQIEKQTITEAKTQLIQTQQKHNNPKVKQIHQAKSSRESASSSEVQSDSQSEHSEQSIKNDTPKPVQQISKLNSQPEKNKQVPVQKKISNHQIAQKNSTKVESTEVKVFPKIVETQEIKAGVQESSNPQVAKNEIVNKQQTVKDQITVISQVENKHNIQSLTSVENKDQVQNTLQVNTVTISKSQYERLLKIQKAYNNRQFEQDDKAFVSGIKNSSLIQRCIFCQTQQNLLFLPTFDTFLICDSCHQKYEITFRVKPYRPSASRNASRISKIL